jgi:hypothetical protein
VKTGLKGKRFQDNENIKRNVTAELNAVFCRPLLTVFKIFLYDSTHVLKLAEITLSINKTVSEFLVFFISFYTLVRELYQIT